MVDLRRDASPGDTSPGGTSPGDTSHRDDSQGGLEFFEELYNHTPIPLHSVDRAGRLISVNDCWVAFTGYPRNAVLGRSVAEFMPPDSARKYREVAWPERLARTDVRAVEYQFVKDSGEIVDVLLTAAAACDEDGQFHHSSATMLDITERKRADQALRTSEEKFRSLYLRTPVMLHSINETGRLISVSGHWLDRMGYELDEVLDRPLTDFLTEESAAREHTIALPQLSAAGRLEQFARQYRRRDETIIETLVDEVVERDATGNFVRSLSVSTDVTERLQMEANLRQAQKMDAVGQLTGGIAHDFNNMLTVISGNLELLSMKLKSRPELQRLAETAIGTTNRAARLTQQLLAFSRKQQLRPEPVQFAQILAGVEELLRRTVGERIALVQDLPGDLWSVTADPNQLESALLNLVLNSRDAMPDGGAITICGRNAQVSSSEAARYADAVGGDYGVLSVIDTGIGMSPAVMAMSIEPFFTTKDVGRGTGLGLSMVYGFVRQSQGHVRIESRVGSGTSVSLYLPSACPTNTPPR